MRIARRRESINPVGDSGHLLRCERSVVREVSAAGIGKPGWHPPGMYVIAYLPCGGFCLLVRQERIGCNLARAMALLAMLLKDGKDVAIEGGHRGRGGTRERPAPNRNSQNNCSYNHPSSPHKKLQGFQLSARLRHASSE